MKWLDANYGRHVLDTLYLGEYNVIYYEISLLPQNSITSLSYLYRCESVIKIVKSYESYWLFT